MENAGRRLQSIFREYADDIELDEHNGVIYFTLNLDTGAEEWMDTHSSAVCYEKIDGQNMITEFDIRISKVSTETVQSIIENLSMRYAVHIDSVDSGHGSGDTAHIRNYNARIRQSDFENFLDILHQKLSEQSG